MYLWPGCQSCTNWFCLYDLMEYTKCSCRFSRTVVEPHTPAYSRIVYHFGPEILLENGEIDRQKLGQLIFASEEKRKLLNSITHPEIHKAMLKEILFYFLRGEGAVEFGSVICRLTAKRRTIY